MKTQTIREAVARGWCHQDQEHPGRIMDAFLAEAIVEEIKPIVDRFLEALIWCSGSDDFQKDGKAETGWNKLCRPLLDEFFPKQEAADKESA